MGTPLPPICHHEAPYGALSPDLGPQRRRDVGLDPEEGIGMLRERVWGCSEGPGGAQRMEHLSMGTH